MTRKQTARARRPRVDRRAAEWPHGPLVFYAIAGSPLREIPMEREDGREPRRLSAADMIGSNVRCWTRDLWDALGAGQRSGHLVVWAAADHARGVIPEDVRRDVAARFHDYLTRVVLEAAEAPPLHCDGCRFKASFIPLEDSPKYGQDSSTSVPRPNRGVDVGETAARLLDVSEANSQEGARERSSCGSPEGGASPDELAPLLRGLIARLPTGGKERAAAAVTLGGRLNQTYWQELRGELKPVIAQLLEDVPEDFDGKQARAALVNALLTNLDLGILVRDASGSHVCSVAALRARPTDGHGSLRLRERTVGRQARRTYPLPLPEGYEPFQVVDVQRGTPEGDAARGLPRSGP